MRHKVRLLLAWTALIPLGLTARGFADIMEALRSPGWAGQATVEVTSPSGESAGYAVNLFESPPSSRRDTIAPCAYLIEWKLMERDSTEGFTALTPGRLTRFDGRRLTELSEADSTLTPASARLQRFAELLPRFIARRLEQASASPDCRITTGEAGPDRLLLTLECGPDTAVAVSCTYTFALPSMALIEARRTSNPGLPTESGVSARYRTLASEPPQVSESLLAARHRDVIGRFAGHNRSPMSFLDFPFPAVTLPDGLGGRYTFSPGTETVVLLIDDTDDPDAAELIRQDVRHALASHPLGAQTDVLYIVTSRFTDAIPASEGPSGHERLLLGGSALQRELGARRLPLLMLVDDEGVVRDVREGVNRGAAPVVIDMLDGLGR